MNSKVRFTIFTIIAVIAVIAVIATIATIAIITVIAIIAVIGSCQRCLVNTSGIFGGGDGMGRCRATGFHFYQPGGSNSICICILT